MGRPLLNSTIAAVMITLGKMFTGVFTGYCFCQLPCEDAYRCGVSQRLRVIMAGTMITLAPTLVPFFAVQNLFVKSLVRTGIKG